MSVKTGFSNSGLFSPRTHQNLEIISRNTVLCWFGLSIYLISYMLNLDSDIQSVGQWDLCLLFIPAAPP